MKAREINNPNIYGEQTDSNNKKKYYYELTAKENDRGSCTFDFYLEDYNNGRETIDIKCDAAGVHIDTSNVLLAPSCYDWSKQETILGSIIKYILLNKDIFSDFRKLEDGYVWNNKYFDDLSSVLYEIEEAIVKNKLNDKFMDEGLTLDDFNDEKLEK